MTDDAAFAWRSYLFQDLRALSFGYGSRLADACDDARRDR
jgi:hypothetical protein